MKSLSNFTFTKSGCFGIVVALLVLSPAMSASDIDSSKSDEKSNEVHTDPVNSTDCFIVDEESRTPEGSVYVSNQVFERHGENYISTNGSIPASLVEQIRTCALESEKFQTPSLKEVGVTPEAL